MKRILAFLLFLVCLAPISGYAQTGGQRVLTNTTPVRWTLNGMVAAQYAVIPLQGLPITDHTFNYTTHPTTSTILVSYTGSTDFGATYSAITTSSTTTGASVHFTGSYTNLKVTITTLTGSGALVDVSYSGNVPASGGAVTVSGNVATTTADGANVTIGSENDPKCATTDATACTLIGLVKENTAAVNTLATAISAAKMLISAADCQITVLGCTTDPASTVTNSSSASANAIFKELSVVAQALQAAITPINSACNILSTASTNSISCKGSAGNRTGGFVINTTATLYYLRLYNTASAPTCSSATGFIMSIPIPASTTGAGVVTNIPIGGVAFATGYGYCLTASSTSTANDNAAAGLFGELYYN